MKMRAVVTMLTVAAAAVVAAVLSGPAAGDGSETGLGPPVGVTIAQGSGIVTAGTGLFTQPGTIDVSVPGAVKQVLLYWEGENSTPGPGDDTLVVNGTTVAGALIGGPTVFGFPPDAMLTSSAFRADITALGLVSEGANSLSVSGMAFDRSDGAGVLVVYDDGSGTADIDIRDGDDLAYWKLPAPLDATVPQAFTFAPSPQPRTATLSLMVGSVAGGVKGARPNAIDLTVNGVTTTILNGLYGQNGAEWDSLDLPVAIPAGATSLSVQLASRSDGSGNDPASLAWVAAGLAVPPPPSIHVEITKTPNPSSLPEPGGDVRFTLVVTNTSAVPVAFTSLTDTDFGNLDGQGDCDVTPPPVRQPGQSYTCAFTGRVTGDAGGPPHQNTVTVVGQIVGSDITDTAEATATVTFTDVLPAIAVDKVVDKPVVRMGGSVTYSFAVTNPGPEPLQGVSVTDDKCSPVTFVSGDTDTDGLLDPTETWRYTCSTTLSADTTNTATATGSDDDGNTVSATDTARVEVIDPRIAIVKTASPTSANPGQAISYSYSVTNPGDDPLSSVVVSDDKCSPVVFGSGDTDGDGKLDPGEVWTYSCSTTASAVESLLTNVGTATGTDSLGGPVTANDTETVTVVLAAVIEQPAPTPQPAPAPPAAPVAGQELPRTGISALGLASAGGAVAVLGAIFVMLASRRRWDTAG